MAKGPFDLFVSRLPADVLILTLGCIDSSPELLTIPANAKLTLVRGKIKQAVQIQLLEGRECFADFMEMNAQLARRFQLHPLRRYLLSYSSGDPSLSIEPFPISETTAPIGSQRLAGISIGYELISKLGIPERQGLPLRIRYNQYVTTFRLKVPNNLSDNQLRLPAQWISRWKLRLKRHYRYRFDQRNRMLTIYPLQ